jgi:chromosome segregation ATPase
MKTVVDRPSVEELERLERAVAAPQLDRAELAEILGQLEQALQDHADDLGRSGGLLTNKEEANRPSLARRAAKVQQELATLTDQARDVSQQADSSDGEQAIRQSARELLGALRRQRNEEADVKLDSVVTDVGSGD